MFGGVGKELPARNVNLEEFLNSLERRQILSVSERKIILFVCCSIDELAGRKSRTFVSDFYGLLSTGVFIWRVCCEDRK